MALTSSTGSSILAPNGANSTFTGLSTNILIRIGTTTVGAVQELQVTERRNIQMIDELGYDGHIDSAPTKATDINGSCTRIRYDRLRMAEAFARGYIHVASQRIPFDMVIIDKWNGDAQNAVITTIKNVWIEQIGYSYSAGQFIITDTMSWQAEAIYSTQNGTNAATGGVRGIQFNSDSVERETDRGARRGALTNVEGETALINTAFNDL